MATATTSGTMSPPATSQPVGPSQSLVRTAAIRRLDAPGPASTSATTSAAAPASPPSPAAAPSPASQAVAPSPYSPSSNAVSPRGTSPQTPSPIAGVAGVASGADTAALLSSGATRRLITLTVLLGFAALLVAGFGTALGTDGQSLVLYVYLSLLLLALPFVVAPGRSTVQTLYTFLGSAFFLVYGGAVVFGGATANFTRSPYTYILLEAVLLGVYVYDAMARRLGDRGVADQGADASDATSSQEAEDEPQATQTFGAMSVDWAGLALFFYIAAFLLDVLGQQQLLRTLGLPTQAHPYVIVDLNAALGIGLPGTLSSLQALDLALAIGATAVALLLFALVGDLQLTTLPADSSTAPSGATPDSGLYQGAYQGGYQSTQSTPQPTSSGSSGLGAAITRLARSAVDGMLRSVRAVVSPLIWLIPAFCAGGLARGVVSYLNRSAQAPGQLLDLFNPLSMVGLLSLGDTLRSLALAALAIVAGLLAVVVADHSWDAARHALAVLGGIGRTVPLTLTLFLYSLAACNVVIALFIPTTPLPFRVGAFGLIALIAAFSFLAGIAASSSSVRASPPAASAPVASPPGTGAANLLMRPRST